MMRARLQSVSLAVLVAAPVAFAACSSSNVEPPRQHVAVGRSQEAVAVAGCVPFALPGAVGQVELTVGDVSGDGVTDLVVVRHAASASGMTEASAFLGPDFTTPTATNARTPVPYTGAATDFAVADLNRDGRADLWVITKGGTASGRVEITVLDAATSFQTALVGPVATALAATDATWTFRAGDFDGDRAADLIGIHRTATGVDVTVLSAASTFATTILPPTTTSLPPTGTWAFWAMQYDADGTVDVMALDLNGTPPVAHLLSGATSFKSRLFMAPASLPPSATDATWVSIPTRETAWRMSAFQTLQIGGTPPGSCIRTASNLPIRHRGPVMHGTVGVHFIWYGDWPAASPTRSILAGLVNGLSGSAYSSTNSPNYDAAGYGTTQLQLVEQVNDPGSMGTSLGYSGVNDVVAFNFSVGRLAPADPNGIYVVLTSKGISVGGFCTYFCANHGLSSPSSAWPGTPNVLSAFVGDPTSQCPSNCAAGATPNGDPSGDAMASLLVHEIFETLADPDGASNTDSNGYENADKCAWRFGTPSAYTTTGQPYNLFVGGRPYWAQQNWVDVGLGSCAMAAPPGRAIPPPGGVMGGLLAAVSASDATTSTVHRTRGALTVTGWTASWYSSDGGVQARVLVDGSVVATVAVGDPPPAGAPGYPNDGFHATIPMNGALADGTHTVTAQALDPTAQKWLPLGGSATFTVVEGPFGWVDGATYGGTGGAAFPPSGGNLVVSGWVADPVPNQTAAIAYVTLLLDGQPLLDSRYAYAVYGASATLHQPRGDVAAAYGRPDYAPSGFSLTVQWSTSSTFPGVPPAPYPTPAPGPHTLTFTATTADGITLPFGAPRTITIGTCETANGCPAGAACMTNGASATFTCSTTGCATGGACNGGCCSNNACTAGTSTSSCGAGGGACAACGAGQLCQASACVTPPPTLDCSVCACGCNANATSCVAPVRCHSAAACARAGGVCDPCSGGCMF